MHDAAGLAPHDEPRLFQDAEVLDESRQRHPERFGKLADRTFPALEARQHRAPGRVGQRRESDVQPGVLILNHLVHYRPWN